MFFRAVFCTYNGVFELNLKSKLENSFPFQTEFQTTRNELSLDIHCLCPVHTPSISGGGGTKGTKERKPSLGHGDRLLFLSRRDCEEKPQQAYLLPRLTTLSVGMVLGRLSSLISLSFTGFGESVVFWSISNSV